MSLTNWDVQNRIKATLDRIEQTCTTANKSEPTRLTFTQQFDSALQTHLSGPYAQVYLCEILKGGRRKSKENSKPVFKP